MTVNRLWLLKEQDKRRDYDIWRYDRMHQYIANKSVEHRSQMNYPLRENK